MAATIEQRKDHTDQSPCNRRRRAVGEPIPALRFRRRVVTKKAAHHPTVGIALKLSLLMLSRVFAIAQVLPQQSKYS
jgi:hypothetical protein